MEEIVARRKGRKPELKALHGLNHPLLERGDAKAASARATLETTGIAVPNNSEESASNHHINIIISIHATSSNSGKGVA